MSDETPSVPDANTTPHIGVRLLRHGAFAIAFILSITYINHVALTWETQWGINIYNAPEWMGYVMVFGMAWWVWRLVWACQHNGWPTKLMSTIVVASAVLLAMDMPGLMPVAVMGTSLGTSAALWPFVKAKRTAVRLALFGVCAAPVAWATSLHLLYPAVFSVEVSASTARWGDTITVDVSGALGIPKGNLLVYLHPEGQDTPLWGSVSTLTANGKVYPLSAPFLEGTAVGHISHHIQIAATLEGHICSMWIDGEGCSPRTLPNGRYQIGLLVPSPFHPGHDIHVPGPILDITE